MNYDCHNKQVVVMENRCVLCEAGADEPRLQRTAWRNNPSVCEDMLDSVSLTHDIFRTYRVWWRKNSEPKCEVRLESVIRACQAPPPQPT
jgi:hypothetical protein